MTDKQKTIESELEVEDKNLPTLADDVLNVKNVIRENTLDVLLDKLIIHFEARKHLYREKQVIAFEQLIKHLKEWNNKGLIKLPMWTGKTFLFAEICKALWLPTIILVPRVGLVNDTKEEMVGSDKKIWVGFKDEEVYTISSLERGTSAEKLQKIFDANDGKFDWVLVTTYTSLNSIRRTSPKLFSVLIEYCGFIVSDEAHRSLWEQTKETGDELFVGEIWNDAEKAERELEEALEESFKWKVHLFTTATPTLIEKDVRDDVSTIYSSTIQEVADDGDLIIPKRVSVWKSFLHIERKNEEGQQFRLSEADLSWPLDKYRDIDWNPLYETLSNRYAEEKEKAWEYLPWVWFCTTVGQAEFVTKHLNSIWVRAVRCTSDKPWISKSVSDTEAKRMLENNEVDVVVTCTKVWEWWDVPTLRSAIWYTPTQSPVKNLQWNGRIMRTISEHLADVYREAMWVSYREKTEDNTMIIEPESWEVIAFEGDMDDIEVDGEWSWNKTEWAGSVKTISWSHEMMYEVWELSKEYLEENEIETIGEIDLVWLIHQHKTELEEFWVSDMPSLLTYGVDKYIAQFWTKIPWKIIWEIIPYIKIEVLRKVGIKLWYDNDVPDIWWLSLPEKIEFHKSQLQDIGIEDLKWLMDFWVIKYKSMFWVVNIRRILWISIWNLSKNNLLELWNNLFWEDENIAIKEHREELKSLWIQDTQWLLDFWVVKYEKTLGRIHYTRIFWTPLKHMTRGTLQDLWEAVFWVQEDTTMDEHKAELENLWIVDTQWLLDFWITQYRKVFWKLYSSKVFWMPSKKLKIHNLEELWDKLFWEGKNQD